MDYFNAKGAFVDPHTVEATSSDGKKVCTKLYTSTLTALTCICSYVQVQLRGRYVVLAVGGRPMYPKNVCISES